MTPPPKPGRRTLQAAARALRAKPGWDPSTLARETPQEALRRLDQAARNASLYADADACPDCTAARARLNDPTALCDAHLSSAMGL
jgi:hypothetical protein